MTAVLAAQAADFVTFAIAVGIAGVAITAESNPSMTLAYTTAGLIGVAVLKTTLAATMVGLIHRITTRPRRPARLVAYALGLAGAASNLVALARVV